MVCIITTIYSLQKRVYIFNQRAKIYILKKKCRGKVYREFGQVKNLENLPNNRPKYATD